jgi:hypothetical protein
MSFVAERVTVWMSFGARGSVFGRRWGRVCQNLDIVWRRVCQKQAVVSALTIRLNDHLVGSFL